ncbi:MFS transporter, DHA1 family, multidrug resistance protein, partial [Lecanoromycetidae sp. Uapishka_2]
MADIIRDTGLGHFIGLVSTTMKRTTTKRKLDLEQGSIQEIKSQNYDLSLKLESQRIVADFLGALDDLRLSSDSMSVKSNDSLAELKGRPSDEDLGWDGPDDPENPLNFSSLKKLTITILICLLTMSVYLGSSIFSPGITSLTHDLHISPFAATLGTAISILGYATGPMFWSPLSETPSIGRNPIYLITLVLFILVQVPIPCAKNLETILIFRFLSGFIGSPAQATGGATISDMYLPQRRSYAIGLWELSTWIAPTLGPLIGGLAAMSKGWRWTIWELMWINCVMLLIIFCFLPETSPSNILYRRAKRRYQSCPPPSEKLHANPELDPLRQSKKAIVYHTLVRPFTLCFREPICLLLNAYTALITGLFFAWLEIFPIVFDEVYGFDLYQLGLAFMGLLVGAVVAYAIFLVWFRFVEGKKFGDDGRRRPEERFVPLMAGCMFIPLSLFIFGWSARRDVHWMVPIVGSGVFSLGSFSLFISILNYLPDAYPDYAASVLAGNNFVRCTFGAGCVIFAGPAYQNLGPGWASTLLGLIGVAFVPVPFLFYFYGNRIRMGSRYARKDF